MSIMPCYPDERSVENELGGKWEYVETIDINGGEVIVYDKDVDNKTPLNINGIMYVCKLTASASSTAISLYGSANDIIYYAGNATNNSTSVVKNVDKNGLCDLLVDVHGGTLDVVYSYESVRTTTKSLITPFNHHYQKIGFVCPDGVTLTGEVDVYFLRGV